MTILKSFNFSSEICVLAWRQALDSKWRFCPKVTETRDNQLYFTSKIKRALHVSVGGSHKSQNKNSTDTS